MRNRGCQSGSGLPVPGGRLLQGLPEERLAPVHTGPSVQGERPQLEGPCRASSERGFSPVIPGQVFRRSDRGGKPVRGGYKCIYFNELIHFDGYSEWVSCFARSLEEGVSRKADAPFNSLPVYGAAYRLAVEATQMASRLERNYRYSLGEDIRRGVNQALVRIMLAGKGEEREANVHSARVSMLEVQLGLRLLNDLIVLPDKRYAVFLDMTEDIIRQLSNWERCERQRGSAAGVSSPP